MTIDEAIKHYEAMAEVSKCTGEMLSNDAFLRIDSGDREECREEAIASLELSREYMQLAEWLTELKEAKRLLKHGYWIEEEPRVLKCSVCGEYAPMNYLGQNCIDSRYCPWCGTKMDSNADEPWQSE
jgi:hypothetical protein